jgi:hypothetical protein
MHRERVGTSVPCATRRAQKSRRGFNMRWHSEEVSVMVSFIGPRCAGLGHRYLSGLLGNQGGS